MGATLDQVRHLVGDVQRFGLLSAVTVVDRYLEVVDRAMAQGRPTISPVLSDERDVGRLAESAARMSEAWLRLLDATAALIPAAAPPGRDILVLPAARAGGTSEASLWVHNPTDSPVADVGLHVTSLVAANGLGLPARAVSFTPSGLTLVEPGTSREVRVRVEVPPDQSAGQYHALLLSSAAPYEPVALSLVVEDTDEGQDERDGRRA